VPDDGEIVMTMRDDGMTEGRARPKKVSAARNASAAVLLITLSAVAYREWTANRQSGAAIRKLNDTLATDKDSEHLLTMEQVEGLIGRKPDGPGVEEGGLLRVRYTWKGVFREYPLTAVYTKQSPPKLLRIE
jgi:hypothetical protein